jgi:uncharacterized membrane protein
MTGSTPPIPARIPALDIARTGAIMAMALYHFVFDLEMFGFLAPQTATTGGWRLLAYATASSFLALAGISLWLAHGSGINWPKALRRIGVIAGAAALISVATWVAIPQAFIHFGILHAIALSSLFGLALLRLPPGLLLALALFAIWAPHGLRADLFNAPWLWWVGLSTSIRAAADYVPILPWIAPFLIGLATAKLLSRFDAWPRAQTGPVSRLQRRLAWPGRHSLAIYLLHQPVLIGLIWLAVQVV